ncbi:MAG: histidinol dehydrogenase [Rhodospirillaceae bacterium]|jgi:sulfopropanediol 3-dehydrogenase|nr:histidinol dehydrogenase [Rhodospirillaceae bacterium]MBT6118932.1 histidinol dehydrogenase [Rhodospirillaceae bacterium]
MAITYLKRAFKTAASDEGAVRETVERMLAEIEADGADRAVAYARDLDGWQGDIVVSPETFARARDQVPSALRDDIAFAHDNVRRFAEAQRQAIRDMEIEVVPGLHAGHRNIPLQTAGCYVPGGRYAHIASAIMSVTTARVAGVETVVACAPPRGEEGIHPATLFALELCGADIVLNLGGVQGVAALAFGLFGNPSADILVGPGNQYVAEAKRALFGRVAIDMFAGPTESCVIADRTADPEIVACDLVGQAEHGYNSPVWLIALDRDLAEAVIALVPEMAESLPEPNRTSAVEAWRDYAEVTVADSREAAVEMADRYVPEHLQVQCADLDWWLANLREYGSLFLGAETTVAFGDKVSGPNHILPTKGAARHTGGLSVGKFLKTLTWQRMTREANREIGPACARISRLEGMEGHARSADIRLDKWYGGEDFDLSPEAPGIDAEGD